MAERKKAKKKAPGKEVKETVPEEKAKEATPGKIVGKVAHYYTNLEVGIIELSDTLKVGDKIKIKGATTDFEQKVASVQVGHE